MTINDKLQGLAKEIGLTMDEVLEMKVIDFAARIDEVREARRVAREQEGRGGRA